ncbi:MAG: DUF1343 domain-containing protein [Armatimonadetes bacterium]|nr:DUF1343 domain-containing protein [Armatimonadota bacterium]
MRRGLRRSGWFALLLLPLLLVPAAAGPTPAIRLGIETLLANPSSLRVLRVGVVTHQAAVTRDGRLTAEALIQAPGVRVAALFAPEHGFDGTRDAGEPVPTIPGRTPVYSLYGRNLRPTRQMLARVDVLVIDLQDVGVRPYTYGSTMALVMTAARAAGKPVVVLDRPNPMGGLIVDGPVLEPAFRSFIGLHPIPLVHGMTIGELARLYNDAFRIGARLTVIPMKGWRRMMTWADLGLEWVNPSPGITDEELPAYYAATGPLDGTNLWNGVATSSRFRVVLAPWLDGEVLAAALNEHNLPGVRFTPSALPHPRTGQGWYGVRLHVTDPIAFRPATTAVYILAEIRRVYGNQMVFKQPRRGRPLFDVVWGTRDVRLALSRGDPAAKIVARWHHGLEQFRRLRKPYLLYP